MNTTRTIGPTCVALLLALPCYADDYGLRVPPGFKVTLYADENLANDIYAMTLDKHGRVVVTSQGWIKILHDTKGLGKADKATVFAKTPTGGMGLCFDGDDLYFCGDGWFSRYCDSKGRGEADGPPEHIVPLHFGEHGGHAMRKGPDGYWYVIGGNDSRLTRREHATLPNSPIRDVEAGALLRLTPDCKRCEVIAHGFRNPYDFDFDAAGDLFTYDSDNEEDFFLPWYVPTRVYHIGYGQHHGWRLDGSKRSWGRPDYYADTVDVLWPVGRGSPTGVACYRHDQFPENYRGGLFCLDWTFGKVYFFPLEADGATYKTKPDVFLESIGTNGFDPTDVVVAPDGSLFISMGGRGTRGAVYRVEYVGDGKTPMRKEKEPLTDLEAVLRAHQPLDAWSRVKWEPLAGQLGANPFAAVVSDDKASDMDRMRAVEVLTELFGGLPSTTAKKAASATSPLVRARVAWSLGRVPCEEFIDILCGLAQDKNPRVRCFALDALADHVADLEFQRARDVLPSNLSHDDKRVRQSAVHLMSILPQPIWKQMGQEKLPPRGRDSALLAALWHKPQAPSEEIIDKALAGLDATNNPDSQLELVRVIILALGDFELTGPIIEAYSPYSVQGHLKDSVVRRILKSVRPLFPRGVEPLDLETARLLAMLEDDDPEVPRRVAARWKRDSPPTRDFHYLAIYARLRAPRDGDAARQVTDAILGLDRKLERQEQRNKQNWGIRLAEVFAHLLQRDPRLADEMLKRDEFIRPGHVLLAEALDVAHRDVAATLFLKSVKKDADFLWSAPLIDLLTRLPKEEVFPLFREQWSNLALRDALVTQFAKHPEGIDRERFLAGLESAQSSVILECVASLEQLPRDSSPAHLVPVLRLLQRLRQEPKEKKLREKALALLNRQTGERFSVNEDTLDAAAIARAYEPVFDWFTKQHPKVAATLNGDSTEDAAAWDKVLQSVDWSKGDAKRGATIFRDRACITCHAGPSRLGPDLTGVATRFSRADLFTAIIYPSKDVAPAYRVSILETKDGKSYSGIVAYESAETVILQTGAATTMRIDAKIIESRRPSNRSLMPDGLLKDLKGEDLADLYTYLRTLNADGAARTR